MLQRGWVIILLKYGEHYLAKSGTRGFSTKERLNKQFHESSKELQFPMDKFHNCILRLEASPVLKSFKTSFPQMWFF